jgi:signal transduction histidine kinase
VAGSAPGAGRWARLAARQPRLGPPADVLPRLLDPLWIASDERTGTGIELGTARDVLVRAGGHLRVAAGEGRGTCVEAFWPM